MSEFVTRFAPSPTGRLHLGHAYSAALAYRSARRAAGRFLLRMEDIDQGRCRPEYEAGILEDLTWLGLSWERPVMRQSTRMAVYSGALDRLASHGLVYRCFKTRKDIAEDAARAPHGADTPGADGLPGAPEGPQYVGAPLRPEEEEARIAAGEPFAWRLSTARAVDEIRRQGRRLGFVMERMDGSGGGRIAATPELFGDPILARKDFPTSYHLASVVDDAEQGVTHVIRGDDLAAAAHLHVLLQALLDLPTPVYRRHPLIAGPDGKRLAKRDRAQTLETLRAEGEKPWRVLAGLGVELPLDAPPPA